MLHSLLIPVTEPSQTGQARRSALEVAASLGFSEAQAGRVALAATEAANNLHLHGRGGELLVRAMDERGVGGVELLALDKGPGVADLDLAMQDGYSTRGTAGQGFGAMKRAADEFDVYSQQGAGTAVLLRFWAGPRQADPSGLESAVLNVPFPGEDVSGDASGCEHGTAQSRFLLVDGLGHGTGAATAAVEAVQIFQQEQRGEPALVLRAIHEQIRHTRGAAAALAILDLRQRSLRYAGVGNVVSLVLGPEGQRTNLVSMNGTLGHAVRQINEFTYPFAQGSTLVMHTDGISTHWSLDRYPGLLARHPSLVAGVLFRDFRRARDDSAIVVAREPRRHW